MHVIFKFVIEQNPMLKNGCTIYYGFLSSYCTSISTAVFLWMSIRSILSNGVA
jgi:hypothetical protein